MPRPLMKTLMLLRHAKAEGQGKGDDFDRALTDRGKAEAASLGDYLGKTGTMPELALVSSAKRARQTFKALAKHAGVAIPARFDDSLFAATSMQLRQALGTIEGSIARLLIVGHNPCIAETAMDMARDGEPEDLARMRSHFPPCGLAVISFAGEAWTDASAAGGRLDAYVTPETLPRR